MSKILLVSASVLAAVGQSHAGLRAVYSPAIEAEPSGSQRIFAQSVSTLGLTDAGGDIRSSTKSKRAAPSPADRRLDTSVVSPASQSGSSKKEPGSGRKYPTYIPGVTLLRGEFVNGETGLTIDELVARYRETHYDNGDLKPSAVIARQETVTTTERAARFNAVGKALRSGLKEKAGDEQLRTSSALSKTIDRVADGYTQMTEETAKTIARHAQRQVKRRKMTVSNEMLADPELVRVGVAKIAKEALTASADDHVKALGLEGGMAAYLLQESLKRGEREVLSTSEVVADFKGADAAELRHAERAVNAVNAVLVENGGLLGRVRELAVSKFEGRSKRRGHGANEASIEQSSQARGSLEHSTANRSESNSLVSVRSARAPSTAIVKSTGRRAPSGSIATTSSRVSRGA